VKTVGNQSKSPVVPITAILPGEEKGTAVLTVSADSTAHKKQVELGVREGDKVQILSGVRPGEEVVVVGGGMAGVCAAVSAARAGLTVALIQDRPVLGGNNSSEVRVWLNGGVNLPPYPRIGDIVAELEPKKRAHIGTA
jgi:NADPH-dependent 2,4-dienoyl-CoA reductase/sulfur reductase-like enzyme